MRQAVTFLASWFGAAGAGLSRVTIVILSGHAATIFAIRVSTGGAKEGPNWSSPACAGPPIIATAGCAKLPQMYEPGAGVARPSSSNSQDRLAWIVFCTRLGPYF